MHRTNSRGYNNTSSTRSNLSDSTSTSAIFVRLWICNVFKAFFSLLSIFQLRRVLRKVNPINCLFSASKSISCSSLSFPCSCNYFFAKITTGSSSDGSKSSLINNCNNISGCNDIPQPKQRKMAQILSKTMTLLGVAFLIHFIIMSTFAEREGYAHAYNSNLAQQSYNRRSQRSYRHSLTPEENTLSPVRVQNKSDAMFYTENSTIITAQTGSKTHLPCAVRNLGSGVVSWIRREGQSYTLLTFGMGTYSPDNRFRIEHNRAAQSWELHINGVKETDEGVYECQVSSHPPSSIFVTLSVVVSRSEILGTPDKHVRSGSTFELVCVLRDSTEPPVYVFWYHNDKMINYDSDRGGIAVNSDSEKSILAIQNAQKSDNGNYTCVPSNAKPTSISVHILNGEKPSAMLHGSRSDSGPVRCSLSLLFVTTVAVFLMTAWLVTTNLNRNLCYLRQLHAPPTPPQPIEQEERKDAENLQLVHIPQKQRESKDSHFLLQRLWLVYDAESACADKVDMRLEAALQEERLRLILSTSRVYILEISYHQNHILSTDRILWEMHACLTNSESNNRAKNVAHVEAREDEDGGESVVSSEHRFNNINYCASQLLSTSLGDLSIGYFSPSISTDPLVPLMSNVKNEPAKLSLVLDSPKFDSHSLAETTESEIISGMGLLLVNR